MIIYQPNYIGLSAIRDRVALLSGGGGNGSPQFLNHLNILGRNLGGSVTLCAGPYSINLADFLIHKIDHGLSIRSCMPGEIVDVPFANWISFNAMMRSEYQNLCAKMIVMTYLTLNNLINWNTQP